MKNQIYPCLWFNGKAKEAAEFYCTVFQNTKITAENPLVVTFESAGQQFMCLNGGPYFTINPSIIEVRNGKDDNCNGVIDEGFETVVEFKEKTSNSNNKGLGCRFGIG